MKEKENLREAILLVFGTFVLLLTLSAVPWSRLTNGVVKDFNLFSDLYHNPEGIEENVTAPETDPELIAAIAEQDSIIEEIASIASTDTMHRMPLEKAPVVGDTVKLEDYTPCGDGIRKIHEILSQSSQRVVRIGVIGDSFIEGDIFTESVRDSLRATYGGHGVGYMAMHSNFPGFRHTVNQSDKGWTLKDIRHISSRDSLRTLAGEYYVSSPGAFVKFKGTDTGLGNDRWDKSTLAFVAPSGGDITFEIQDSTCTFEVSSGAEVQFASVSANTGFLKISTDIPGLKVLGAWMDGETGVAVDCMSLRGNSGASHRQLHSGTIGSLGDAINYDIIILEYGMNALSAQQKDYSAYGALMEKVIVQIQQVYPQAAIIMLGTADRGTKIDGQVVSMPSVVNLIQAQRQAACRSGILFWDTRQAMGGDGAAVEWRKKGWLNADYVHLNHKGGKELGRRFVKAL